MAQQENPPSFLVKDCALAAIATGIKAYTLGEFRDRIQIIPAESIYYHFWRQKIETSLNPSAFSNDFSHWAYSQLRDETLAERLNLIDPSEYADLEKLRIDIIDIVDHRLDEKEGALTFSAIDAFHFIRSKIVVFNTPFKLEHPRDLVKTIPALSRSSVFYHVIDARRREQISEDDFSTWLKVYKNEFLPLIEMFKQIDPYFMSLTELQQRLSALVTDYFLGYKGGP